MARLLALILGTVLLAGGLGFGAARLVLAPPVQAVFETELREVLLAGSTDQIRRRFTLGLTPQERISLGEVRPEGVTGEAPSVLELLSTRGDGELVDIALGSMEEPDEKTVLASVCVSARLGHSAQLRRIARALPDRGPQDPPLCAAEGRPPSEVARRSGHGGTAELMSEQGL